MRNYYEILNVDFNSDQSEIKKSFYNLVKKFHPDLNKSPNARKRFELINEAYETLSDSEKRSAYDRVLIEEIKKKVKRKEKQKKEIPEKLRIAFAVLKVMFFSTLSFVMASIIFGSLKKSYFGAEPILLSLATLLFTFDRYFWVERILSKNFFTIYKILRGVIFSVSISLVLNIILESPPMYLNLDDSSKLFMIIPSTAFGSIITSMEDYTNLFTFFWFKNFFFHARKIFLKTLKILAISSSILFLLSRIGLIEFEISNFQQHVFIAIAGSLALETFDE